MSNDITTAGSLIQIISQSRQNALKIEVIAPNHDCEELKLPEKCLFAFLGDAIHILVNGNKFH